MGQNPLEHPEIKKLLPTVFDTIVSESDRGAVVIGFAQVDNHLEALFQTVAPASLGKKLKERVLEYPGPLSSASAKADIALFTRLIPRHLYDAISKLRKIRNAVAHSPEAFRLSDHETVLRSIGQQLGPGMHVAINRMALELTMRGFEGEVLSAKDPDSNNPLFKDPNEVFEYLSREPELMAQLGGRALRYELAYAVVLICAMLVRDRDKVVALVGPEETLATLYHPESQ
jgi:hypothetical protein